MKSYFKKQFALLLVLIFCLILFFLFYFRVIFLSDEVFIYFCDVGQGDAILVQYGYFQMLIDAGPDEKIIDCLFEFMPKGDFNLEIGVVTHADNDHFKGFNSVLNKYLVGEMWLVPFSKDGDDFDDFKEILKEKMHASTRLRVVKQGDFFSIGKDFNVAVLWPQIPTREATETILSDKNLIFTSDLDWENDLSIVLKLSIFEKEVLLTGDIEKNAEQALLTDNLISRVQVLKVAHHGSKTSSTQSFLQIAQPEIAAISSGVKNQHGHPAEQTISSLESIEATILRTDQLSTFGLLFEKEKGIKVVVRD